MPVSADHAVRLRADLTALGAVPVPAQPIGIAVSGGPDSLALLLLAHAAFAGAVIAATVDHGLRAAAAVEAQAVTEICAALCIPHRILTGDARAGNGPVQARARHLRYHLLGTWAAEHGVGWVATAHHLDDQAETFLMRAARGSGTAGLAGVRGRAVLPGMTVPVVRPLLGWNRGELAGIVAAAGLTPADDPSNRDPAYDRTSFRALLAATPLLRPAGLAAAAANLAEAEEVIAWAAGQAAAERIADAPGGALLLADPAALPRELRRRLLGIALTRLGATGVRGGAIDRMLHLLDTGRAATLAGVQARPGHDWRLCAAPPRRERKGNRDGTPGGSIAINPEPLI